MKWGEPIKAASKLGYNLVSREGQALAVSGFFSSDGYRSDPLFTEHLSEKHPAAQSLIFSLAKARHDIKVGCKGTLMH